MTKLELMRMHKAMYANLEARIARMPAGLSRDVARTLTLAWIKGYNWEGGLSGGRHEVKAYAQLANLGYKLSYNLMTGEPGTDWDRVEAEFERQQDLVYTNRFEEV